MWDIWPRDCREQLAAYMRGHAAEFAAEGLNVNPDNILHPIHDQVCARDCCMFAGHDACMTLFHEGLPRDTL